MMSASATFSATPLLWPVWANTNQTAAEFTAIERGHRSTGFMPFHLNSGKALTITREEIFCHFERANQAIFCKERRHALFCSRSGETAN